MAQKNRNSNTDSTVPMWNNCFKNKYDFFGKRPETGTGKGLDKAPDPSGQYGELAEDWRRQSSHEIILKSD